MYKQFYGPPQSLSNSATPSSKLPQFTLIFKVRITANKKQAIEKTPHGALTTRDTNCHFPNSKDNKTYIRKTRRKNNYVHYYWAEGTQLVETLAQRRTPASAMLCWPIMARQQIW